ncbi:DUF6928 family protein [Pseudoduganella albidiflava]|uniref:Uncharacterized protein n=1 Tax=Pseudoduganella albidiflava TaxID=321983 RepID=A0A411X4W6_9BURK|nr:hypothetical protein [Pseudoduganella albidiflava]QBI03895.1 hypothetical protein EYF70_26085 [Pseudoduganella albidiflava]GGY23077.1 hypothetical protein GCM10007387_00510 [Pseudoduganella albidiflava]
MNAEMAREAAAMRWELSIVCATDQPGSFGTPAGNDAARAAGIVRELAADGYEHAGEVSLWHALHPGEDAMFVGAYSGGVLVCHADLAGALIHGNAWSRVNGSLRGGFRETLLGLYPRGEVMAMALHCVAQLWGFSTYRESRRVRTVAGSGEDGLFADHGVPLAEEIPVLAHVTPALLERPAAGEALVLAASARMFGDSIDQLGGTGPTLSHYRRRPAA